MITDRCPKCGDRVLQRVSDGSLRLRVTGVLEVAADGSVRAQCHWCRERIELPVVVGVRTDIEEAVDGRRHEVPLPGPSS